MAATARTAALTVTAMIAFAANSLLCRAALRGGAIDAASFTAIRLVSGAAILAVLARRGSAVGDAAPAPAPAGSWPSAIALTAYAIAFSIAYLRMGAGTGALILFAAVQITMIAGGVIRGERPAPAQWLGVAIALGGLVTITTPTLQAPPPVAAALMAGAGIAWGVYSLRGRGVADPLAATARNFVRAAPMALALSVVLVSQAHADRAGIALAIASGAITSGLGYVIWYAALPKLTALRAATVQLSVPPIAAFGGVLFLAEAITPRLMLCSVAILGGIGLVLAGKTRMARSQARH